MVRAAFLYVVYGYRPSTHPCRPYLHLHDELCDLAVGISQPLLVSIGQCQAIHCPVIGREVLHQTKQLAGPRTHCSTGAAEQTDSIVYTHIAHSSSEHSCPSHVSIINTHH